MSNTRYVFDPRPEVADWIDENIKSWTSFCYDNIYRSQKKKFYQQVDNIGNKLSMILFGCIFIAISYIVNNLIPYLIFILVGIILILFGFSMILLEVRNGRR